MNVRLLRADEIECRVQTVKPTGFSLLLYKDARCDMRILDETFGAENWQRTHEVINGNLFCNVTVWDKEKSQWILKQDVGTESNTEKEKGQASDSFKRACFNWGIGRELYTAPFIWITGQDPKAKYYVKEIAYNDNREITKLIIQDVRGNVVYPTTKPQSKATSQPSTAKVTEAQLKRMYAIGATKGIVAKQINDIITKDYDRKPEEMDRAMYDRIVDRLERAEKKWKLK